MADLGATLTKARTLKRYADDFTAALEVLEAAAEAQNTVDSAQRKAGLEREKLAAAQAELEQVNTNKQAIMATDKARAVLANLTAEVKQAQTTADATIKALGDSVTAAQTRADQVRADAQTELDGFAQRLDDARRTHATALADMEREASALTTKLTTLRAELAGIAQRATTVG